MYTKGQDVFYKKLQVRAKVRIPANESPDGRIQIEWISFASTTAKEEDYHTTTANPAHGYEWVSTEDLKAL